MSKRRTPSVNRVWYLEKLKARKLTQRAFARKCGFHLTSVIRLLGGKRTLRIDEVSLVANVLGVSVEDVLLHSGLELSSLSSNQESSKGSANVVKEPPLSEKLNEYVSKDYWVTAAICRGIMGTSYEIGIRRKSDGRFWLLQSEKYNHQTVQEMCEIVCLTLEHESFTPEWCQEMLT